MARAQSWSQATAEGGSKAEHSSTSVHWPVRTSCTIVQSTGPVEPRTDEMQPLLAVQSVTGDAGDGEEEDRPHQQEDDHVHGRHPVRWHHASNMGCPPPAPP